MNPSLAAALAAFQAELPTVPKTKNAHVPTKSGGSYSYKYADLADVSGVVMPLLGKHGLSFSSQPGMHDGQFGLAYQLLHESGELLDGFYPITETGSPQYIGGLITYARRYCLSAVTGVAAEEDTDGHAGAGERAQPSARGKRPPPPPRALEDLPRNRDGTLSRSRCTEEELQLYGAMNDEQQKEHNKLRREVLGTDAQDKAPDPTEHLAGTPPEDPFYDPPPAAVRAARAAMPAAAALHMHFGRLLGKPTAERTAVEIRGERIAAYRTIVNRPDITSTNDLTAGEAVQVKRFAEHCRDHEDLIAALAQRSMENDKAAQHDQP